MKKFIATMLLGLTLATATGCTSETEHGECVGVTETKNPGMRYEFDAGNIILALIFSETIIVPIWVVLEAVECPVGPRAKPAQQ